MVPRPAATLILARDGADGIEVFLMQRTQQAKFMAGAFVFPGGAVDPADSQPVYAAHTAGLDDTGASRILGIEQGGLAYWIAAIRECFEESGLLLATDESGEIIRLEEGLTADAFASYRNRLAAGELSLAELCRTHGLRLATDRLVYFGHWTTPAGLPKRFDTRFFIAVAPPGQTGVHDNCETIDHAWIRPADALARCRAGEITLAFATTRTLESLATFRDTASMMAHARAQSSVKSHLPRVARGRNGRQVLVQGDHAYAEIGMLDPVGEGTFSCEIVPGVPVRLSSRVRRIAAPNPGFMTGPGTNAYLLGSGEDIAVIDPGPALDEHIDTLLKEADGRIRWILVTHTHPDHSPAAAILKSKTGAQLLGMPPPENGHQDHGFMPDRILSHGERLDIAGCTLRVLHTPGHASNHLCYLLEEERLVFTGDHVMQGSTVVINPPDGDMSVYLASLKSLQQEEIAYLAPGHGFVMDKPREVIDRLLAHRLGREKKVIEALRQLGAATAEELVPVVYNDVPERRHAMAARSLLAHLIKLKEDGRASESNGRWEAIA
ncbi:MAG: fold metallo-hydrolase [Herminiimonas sp.]|nr:fold metallo-hydrolase [Herminiimonas sp.]